MPHTTSAIKHIKTDEKRRVHHKTKRNIIKALDRKIRKGIENNNAENVKEDISQIFSKLDKAAKTGTIHKKKADRKKSRMAKLVARIKKGEATPAESVS